jgi:hypothetical protein
MAYETEDVSRALGGVSSVAVAKPFMRKRGNPYWGRPRAVPLPFLLTEFEREVGRLGLTKQTFLGSHQLRAWCERNRNRCYIPEWLLGEWGIEVDDNLAFLRPGRVPSYPAARLHSTSPER